MPLDLSTLTRVKARLDIASTATSHDQILRALTSSVSSAAERFLSRHVLTAARTEDYSLEPLQRVVFLKGYPVTGAATIVNDFSREFTTGTIPADAYHLESTRGRVEFDKYVLIWGPGVLRVTYTGGMGLSLLRLKSGVGTVSGTMTPGNVVEGQTSLARGTLSQVTTGVDIDIDVDSGAFINGETVKDVTALGTVPLTTITQVPIIQEYPDMVEAVEREIVYRWMHRNHHGLTSASIDGGSVSYDLRPSGLLAITERGLDRHRRMVDAI